jgi:hypothetical protein
LHCPTTALTTIADRVEPVQHRIFEERVMDMSTIMLGNQDRSRLICADPASFFGMVRDHERRKRLPDDQTNIERETGLSSCAPARTVQYCYVIRILEDQ